ACEANRVIGGVYSREVGVANGEGEPHGVVATHKHRRVVAVGVPALDGVHGRAVAIPEGNKRLSQSGGGGASGKEMGIAPLGGVDTADVVATDEGCLTVHDQQLAMVERVTPRIQQVPWPVDPTVFENMDPRWKLFEGGGHDQIAEHVEDEVDLHSLFGLAHQPLLQSLTRL